MSWVLLYKETGDAGINVSSLWDLEYWQFDCNWRRPHGSLNGKTPAERDAELSNQILDREAVAVAYIPSREHVRFSNSTADAANKFLVRPSTPVNQRRDLQRVGVP